MISEQVKKGQYSELYVNPYSRRYKLSRLFWQNCKFYRNHRTGVYGSAFWDRSQYEESVTFVRNCAKGVFIEEGFFCYKMFLRYIFSITYQSEMIKF